MRCVLLCASLWVAIQTSYRERSVCPRISRTAPLKPKPARVGHPSAAYQSYILRFPTPWMLRGAFSGSGPYISETIFRCSGVAESRILLRYARNSSPMLGENRAHGYGSLYSRGMSCHRALHSLSTNIASQYGSSVESIFTSLLVP